MARNRRLTVKRRSSILHKVEKWIQSLHVPHAAFDRVDVRLPGLMLVWSALSWSISPSMQSYLIKSAPESASLQIVEKPCPLYKGTGFLFMLGGAVGRFLNSAVFRISC